MKNIAETYYELGLNPTCISYLKTLYNSTETNPEKSPCHSWRRWQVRRPGIEEIINLPWESSIGIGTVLGYPIRCIDIDHCDSLSLVKDVLKRLKLPEDYEWVVKTPNGFHIYIQSPNLPFATSDILHEGVLALDPNQEYRNTFKRLELRWANHSVLPPTIINGVKYEFINTSSSYPKSKPNHVDSDRVFSFIVKYCGSLYGKSKTQLSGGLLINDTYFSVAFPSEYPASLIFAYKILDINNAFTTYNDYRVLNRNMKDSFKLEGVWNSERYRTYEDWGYYTNYLEDPMFIDIETTGLIKDEFDYDNYPRVIQLAFSIGFRKEVFSYYIKPKDYVVPTHIENLTGITTTFLNENGIAIESALRNLNKKSIHNPIVTFNTDFDISILDSEFLRLQKNRPNYYENYLRDGSQIFCLMKKFNAMFGGKYPKLHDVYSHYFKEIPPVQLHNAANDLEILIDCYYIMELYGHIRIVNDGRTLE